MLAYRDTFLWFHEYNFAKDGAGENLTSSIYIMDSGFDVRLGWHGAGWCTEVYRGSLETKSEFESAASC